MSIFAASMLAAVCQPEPRPPPPAPDAGGDSGVEPDAAPEPTADAALPDVAQPDAPELRACVRACQTLSRLQCAGGEDGAKCVATCEATEASAVARFCPEHVAIMIGKATADGGTECDPAELERAFSACERR